MAKSVAKREVKRWRTRALQAESAAAAANNTVAALLDEVRALNTALRDQPATILTNLTPLFLGYRDPIAKDSKQIADTVGSGVSFDDKERGVWFPDIEFDETMESRDRWPEPGRISTPPTGMTRPVDDANHTVLNGTVMRNDGQTMFQAGATSPPPESGVE
jgi:hypothetical protein